jgi:RNA polymerase sigma-70 factor (ECF subfamily)
VDKARFRSEFERIRDQLYTFLVRTTRDPHGAADILQEAAYMAYRSRRRFRGESSFKTWIYRIAINALRNQWAKQRREKDWAGTPITEERVEESTPESLLTGKEKVVVLTRALDLLEEDYRTPFLLRHMDGLSYREISQVLGIGESAARVRVHRARHALMTLLESQSGI